MGAVYKAFDQSLEIDVAIKENSIVSEASERQFKREAKLLAALRHPNLPRVTEHFVVPDQGQYLVMDFVPGEDIMQKMRSHGDSLPEDEVMKWAKEILQALDYLHNRPQPVLHRDIKPGNIKITPAGRAVLVDFGLAKFEDPNTPTTKGAKAYTPGFAPPEQYGGAGRTDSRTDIYSFGATLYMMLTGQVPTDSLKRMIGEAKLPGVRELNPSISPHVAEAIERALELQPDDRFGSVKEFENALTVKEPVSLEDQATRLERPPIAPTIVSSDDTLAPQKLGAQAAVDAAVPMPQLPDIGEIEVPKRRSGMGIVIAAVVVVGIIVVGAGGYLLFGGSGDGAEPTEVSFVGVDPTEDLGLVVETEEEEPIASPTPSPIPVVLATATPVPTPTPAGTPMGGGAGQIAFASDRSGIPQIFVIKVDGSGVSQLTDMIDGACQPAWSPDGQQLLFTSPCKIKQERYPQSSIFIANADGSNVRPFITTIGGAFDAEWNEAGIVFTNLESNQPRVWIAGPDGRSMTRVTIGRSDDSQPSWSPDGQRIAFVNSLRAGVQTIFWMFPDGTFSGSNPDQITRGKAADSPAWSPNGDMIAYTSESLIWVIPYDANGFDPARIRITAGNDDPAWSPDGSWIVFESWESEATHNLYIMNPSGGQVTRLTEDTGKDFHPAWRP
jgi:sugar lactone lactonase YvrE